MPRTNLPPSYRFHKARNCAVVTIDGRNHYLGPFGSPESKEKYARLIVESHATLQQGLSLSGLSGQTNLTVNEVILTYWKYAQTYYVKHGQPTDEQAGIRSALRFLRHLYGLTPAHDFSPLGLKAVRETMIETGLSRGVVNKYVQRIRRMFRWGVENELVTVDVYQALMTIAWLREGRCKARELPPVRPVSDAHIDATLPHLPKIVQAMVLFQRMSGCRPEDVFNLRPRHVDTKGEVWCCQPDIHKMEHTGRPCRFFIGPKAQEVLRPFLDRAPEALL